MNVVFVCEGYHSQSVIAQPWRHVYEIAHRMQKSGHTVKILTDQVHSLPKTENIGGIPVYRIKKHLLFLDSKELLHFLNDESVDLINWYGGPLSTFYFGRLKNKIQKNIVWTMYKGGLTFEDIKNMKLSELFSLFNNILYLYSLCPKVIMRNGAMAPNVKKIVVWSKRVKEYLNDLGIPDKQITLIPSGVDADQFNSAVAPINLSRNELLGFDENDPVLLYFGPLTSLRGSDVLISAMPKVTEKIRNARLLMLAREYTETEKNDKLLQKGQADGTIKVVSGILSPSEIVQYLSSATVIVLPFKSWPHQECPLTILEAMAMEKPVITTQMGAIPEIVQDRKNGMLVPPGDSEALARKIVELLSNDALATEIGKNARNTVEQIYDWNSILEQTLAVFEDSV